MKHDSNKEQTDDARGELLAVIDRRIADYEELESRNDLTEKGKHGLLVTRNIRRDMEFALRRPAPVPKCEAEPVGSGPIPVPPPSEAGRVQRQQDFAVGSALDEWDRLSNDDRGEIKASWPLLANAMQELKSAFDNA